MSVTNTPIYPQKLFTYQGVIDNGVGTSEVQIFIQQEDGAKLTHINCINTDTNAYTIKLYLGTSFVSAVLLTTINIPASSGNTTSAPALNLLKSSQLDLPKDSNGNPYLYIGGNYTFALNVKLYAVCTTTVSFGKVIQFTITGETF